MDALKAAVGLGKKEQSGQEPVSGVKGSGTAAEPYDSGNQEDPDLGGKAEQETDTSRIPGESAVDDKIAGAADSTTTSGKSGAPVTSHGVPEAAYESVPAANESETSKALSSSESGNQAFASSGQSSSAIPFRERQGDEGAGQSFPSQATTGATDHGAVTESSETQSGLPPNHLGANVPAEIGTEPVDAPPSNQPTFRDTMSPSTPAHISEAAMHDTTPAPGTAHPQLSTADRDAKQAAEQPRQYIAETNPASQQQQTAPSTSTGGALFSNPFSPSSNNNNNNNLTVDSPASSLEKRRLSREAYGSNPHAIPTAGGKRVGSVAYEQRRSMSLSPPLVSDVREEEDGQGRGGMGGVNEVGDAGAGMSEVSKVQRAPETMAAGTEWGVPTNFTPFSPSGAATVGTDEAPPRASLSPSGEGRGGQ
ncbi:hypothetical protein LTS16_014153 [Friedmanniomyces endolithicus]|nr:hypothetical protein LTS16_014153 [Friedmanniomyces endolithicus]